MRRQVATIMAALSALFLSAPFASVPLAVHAQTDPIVDVRAVDQVMHDYVETYSRGDMAAVMKFINVPFMVAGPKGFTAFTTADEVLEWYTTSTPLT